MAHIVYEKGDVFVTRFFIFLLSYGLLVVSSAQLILYLNYRSLGYEWDVVIYYIIRTTDFTIFIGSLITLMLIVFFRGPFGSPFSSG